MKQENAGEHGDERHTGRHWINGQAFMLRSANAQRLACKVFSGKKKKKKSCQPQSDVQKMKQPNV